MREGGRKGSVVCSAKCKSRHRRKKGVGSRKATASMHGQWHVQGVVGGGGAYMVRGSGCRERHTGGVKVFFQHAARGKGGGCRAAC